MHIPYVKEIIFEVKSKKELKNLDDNFIENKLQEFFAYKSHTQEKDAVIQKLSSSKNYKQFTKSREHAFLLKSLRAELRKIYGVFIKENFSKRESLLKEMDANNEENILEVVEQLLDMHQSTKERAPYYQDTYDQIFETITSFGEKKSKFEILDLGCGHNPLSAVYIKDKIKEYIASDISKEDCIFIERFFKKINLPGRAQPMDITLDQDLKKVEAIKVDICFLFKVLDTIERIKLDITQTLLDHISAKYVVVSFPTESLSGKKVIRHSKRQWFIELLAKQKTAHKIEYKEFMLGNEIFYVIKK